MSAKRMYRVVFSGCLLALSLPSYADNTEIYFNPKQTTVKPNVFFILDRSLSMDADPNGKTIGMSQDSNAPDLQGRSKLNLMKESFQQIFAKDQIGGFRVGVMDFGSGYPNITQEIINVDEIDHSRDISQLGPVYNGNKVSWSQPVWIPTDDGYQNGATQNNWLDFTYGDLDLSFVNNNKTRYFAYRFDNILLKPVKDDKNNGSNLAGPDYGIESAKLSVYLYAAPLDKYSIKKQIEISIDPNLDSQYLRPRTKNDLSTRYNAAKQAGSTYKVICSIPPETVLGRYECDVTDLVRQQIARDGWKGGNAMTFILRNASFYIKGNSSIIPYLGYLRFKEYLNGQSQAYLKITAKQEAIAENKRTKKELILDKVFKMTTSGATETNLALLTAAQYISNIPNSNAISVTQQGPYHSDGRSKYYVEGGVVTASNGRRLASPLTEGCQLTHFILMSDGQPTASYYSYINSYMYRNYKGNSCTYDETGVGSTTEQCGRALVKWLAKTNSGNFTGPNYIRTNTIGFGMVTDSENGKPSNSTAVRATNYLRDLASYGEGNFYATVEVDELVDAFRSIINNALSVSTTAVSGQVLTSATKMIDQRREVFYTFYQSGAKDYWPGNTKGFKMSYPTVTVNGQDIEIPVLKDWYDSNVNAIDNLGNFKAVSSAWSKEDNINGDAANINVGGVVNRLPDADKLSTRPLYTALADNLGLTSISSKTTQITPDNLGFDNNYDPSKNDGATKEQRTKGLLDFMRGYVYQPNGGGTAARGKKLGDSIASGVTLVSYGCNTNDAKDTLLNCNYDDLNLVGLLASNDGVFRAYDLVTGNALYEFMPKEMLPVIDKLQKQKELDTSYVDNDGVFVKEIDVKTYGLDGNVVVYHNEVLKDENKNPLPKKGFIKNGDDAFAYVSAGRGGPYFYIFDISKKASIRLVKTYKGDELATLAASKNNSNAPVLGNTWSEPVVGKIKTIDGKVIPVVVFGAGYDVKQDDPNKGREEDSVGNGVYVLNATTGEIIWSVKTNFSVPGGVALYTKTAADNGETYISDLFFGDMGGQLWRFHMNESGSIAGNDLFKAVGNNNGVIATISGNGTNDHRRFYQRPFVYNLGNDGVKDTLAVNIGSGYKAHPLVTGNQDRFYSFRVPEAPDVDQSITEDDLGVLTLDSSGSNYIKDGKSIAKGFMVELQSSTGEKVLSNPYVLGGTVVFSTYVPPDNSINLRSCVPNSGRQRTYSIDIVTGKNLLQTAYLETDAYGLPSDTAVYCGDRYCTMVTNVGMLDGTISTYDCSGDNCKLPFTYDKGKEGAKKGTYIKTGWTDMFSL